MYNIIYVPNQEDNKPGHIHRCKTFEEALGIWEYKRLYPIDLKESNWMLKEIEKHGMSIEYLDNGSAIVMVKEN